VLKNLKSGPVIVCPNNKRTGEDEEPKPRRRKGKAEEPQAAPVIRCTYSRPAPEQPQAGAQAAS